MNLLGRCVIVVATTTSAWADKAPPKQGPKQPAIAGDVAARIPAAGHLVSYRTGDDHLVVARITKTGPKQLLRTPFTYGDKEQWIDPTTLVLVSVADDKTVEVRRVVDGAIDPNLTVKLPLAAWKLRGKDEIKDTAAYLGADGGIWIWGCVKFDENALDCKKAAWLRADVTPPKATYTKPAKLAEFSGALAPTVKAPAGHKAKLAKVPSPSEPRKKIGGLECINPKGKASWGHENDEGCACQFTPKKVRWILTDPPMFEAEGTLVNPVGQETRERYVFRGCETKQLDEFAWVGAGMWSSVVRADDKLTVYVGTEPVAIFEGTGLHGAP